MNSVEYMSMFPLDTSILLGGASTRSVRKCAMLAKEVKNTRIFLFCNIISTKDFDLAAKLGFDPISKIDV